VPKSIALALTAVLFLVAPEASATSFDLRALGIEAIDEVPSFTLTMDGIQATVSANVGVLNRTNAAFGINIVGTTCGGQEASSQIDDGCSGLSPGLGLDPEAVSVFFDQNVLLESLKVSSFGSSDEALLDGHGFSIDISNTGTHDLGDLFLGAGNAFTLSFVAGNGFSFDNFAVSSTPIPEPSAGLVFLVGLAVVHRGARRLKGVKS